MNINDRIMINSDELFENLESKLDMLRRFQYDSRYSSLLGDKLVDKLGLWDKSIRRQKDYPMTIAVCGEFKRGKSSLINALLNEDVVTTNITTETITVNRISYGEHSNELVLAGGRRIKLRDEELKCENLRAILEELSATDRITTLEIKRPIEMLKEITIIDTPGLGDSIKDFSAEVDFALKQADVVIYIFSVSYPLSIQEQFFIRTAIKPQKYTELFLMANSCDLLETIEDCERVKRTVMDRLSAILPDESPLMVSSLDERCRTLGIRRPNEDLEEYLACNFDHFRNEIDNLIATKRSTVVLDRVQRMISSMLKELGADIDAVSEALALSQEDLKKKKEEAEAGKLHQSEYQNEITELIDEKTDIYISRVISWMSELLDKMESDVDDLANFSVDDIKKYYALFCVDTLQEAFDKCSDYYSTSMLRDTEKVSEDVAKKLAMDGMNRSYSFKFNLNNHTWTKGDTVEAANTYLNLGVFSLLTTFVAGAMRQHEMKGSAPDIIKNVKEQYSELRSTVAPAVRKNYIAFANEIKKQLCRYFEEEMESIDANLEQAEYIFYQNDAKKNEVKAALDELSCALKAIESELLA